MRRISISFVAVVAVAGAAATFALRAAPNGPVAGPQLGGPANPVLVELFTSQGCSSCPPADALVERVAQQPNVVAITRPVTYWDRLGWKDTLGREENTRLQNSYAQHGGTGAGVYTPQVVVNGGNGVVGSDERGLRGLLSQAGRDAGPTISIQPAGGGRTVDIAGGANQRATVSVYALRSSVSVAIGAGENGGRRVRYTNVFLGERRIGTWAGGKASLNVPADALHVTGADRYALIVQQAGAGRVLAARYL
jgi:hypothetical protein